MNQKLVEALDEIRDDYIQEAAAKPRRKFRWKWVGAIAAVLALVILISSLDRPILARAVSLADYSSQDNSYFHKEANAYAKELTPFFGESIRTLLSGVGGENMTYSPVNLFMALAAVAELSGGDRQILDALGMENLEALRSISTAFWNGSFRDGPNRCLLANSLWLDKGLRYDQVTMDNLAKHHYTSVYQGDLGSRRTNRDIANWLNNQTGNMLKESTANIQLNPNTVFALYATIYYQAKWQTEFRAGNNTAGIFHSPQGDRNCTFMNRDKMQGYYYWGEDFGAITLQLKDGSTMWLILPDADKTPGDVLNSQDFVSTVFRQQDETQRKYMYINLSLPKFDIATSGDLKSHLQRMGITHVFDAGKADFTAALPDFNGPVWLAAVNQSTRVAIDEKGVTASSYIEIPGAGAAAPPEEIIDFVLDRPFLFVIQNASGIPLFAGIVNRP